MGLSHGEQTIDDVLIFSGNFHLLKKYIESFGKKPIFLTGDGEFKSTETKTRQWVCEQTDFVLVTTPFYIKGFECEAIIYFTTMQEPEVLSRATVRVIKVLRSGRNGIINIGNLTKMIGM